MKQTAVVILNYNGAGMLRRFLPSVIEYSLRAVFRGKIIRIYSNISYFDAKVKRHGKIDTQTTEFSSLDHIFERLSRREAHPQAKRHIALTRHPRLF